MSGGIEYYRAQASSARRDAEYQRKRANKANSECRIAKAICINAFEEFVKRYGTLDDIHEYADRMRGIGIEVQDES